MLKDILDTEIAGLKAVYGEIEIAESADGKTLLKIKLVQLPQWCTPQSTSALVVVDQLQTKPQVYVKNAVKFNNGNVPRNLTPIAVEGQEWHQFSFNVPWDENTHSLIQFVAASLNRFEQQE